MNILLDTHGFLWFINGDTQLPRTVQKTIAEPDTTVYLSIASVWEIAIKLSVGKLKLDVSFDALKEEVLLNGFEILPIEFQHLQALLNLDFYHRDPFDRIIIAQAISEGMTLISKDSHFSNYKELKLLWE